MAKGSDTNTKTRILDSAELAFADFGFEAASLRHIIAVAGVNLAAVHYHFGSKEGLIRAVFARRIGPLNEERLATLDAVETRAGKKAPSLEQILQALIGPALRLASDSAKGGANVMRLFGRTIAEPSDDLQAMFRELFGDVAKRFIGAFHRACPELPGSVLFWRFHFVIGAMAQTMCDHTNIKLMSGGKCDLNNTDEVLEQMASFLAAGFRAPVKRASRTVKKRKVATR